MRFHIKDGSFFRYDKTFAADLYLIYKLEPKRVLSYLTENDPSYEFIGEVILKINIVYKTEKIKAEFYVNQEKSWRFTNID